MNGVMEEMTTHYKIRHRFSTPNHPQCNGQAKSTNKILINVLKKVINDHMNN